MPLDRFGPVFSFKVVNQLIVVLQDYDVIKEAMEQYQLSGRPSFEISQLTMPGHGTYGGKTIQAHQKFQICGSY